MQKKKRLIQISTILIFTGILGIFSIWNALAPKETVSWNENRTLAPAPDLSPSHIFGGRFDDDFETWFSDHYMNRDFWIELKSMIRRGMLAIENNDIYYAKEERLVSRFASADKTVLDSNAETILTFAKEHNVTPNILLVPTAAWGASSTLPAGHWDLDQKAMLEELETTFAETNYIPIMNYLPQDPSLYFRTDHHWNEQGAWHGYEAICAEVLHKEPNAFRYEDASSSFCGTMYSKSGAFWTKPDMIRTIIPETPVQAVTTLDDGRKLDGVYNPARLAEKDQYTYYIDGNHAREDIHTDVNNGRTAVIVKDSYSHILVPYLITEYEDLILIDLRYYHAPVSDLLGSNSDLYFIYSLDNFASDPNLAFLR